MKNVARRGESIVSLLNLALTLSSDKKLSQLSTCRDKATFAMVGLCADIDSVYKPTC